MGDKSKIEWTEATWNFFRGCSRLSAGCQNCYAERMASRFSGPGKPYEGLTQNGKWTGEVRFIEEKLDQPLRWTRPRIIFVNSMSDTFHPNARTAHICMAFDVMRKAKHHIFQVLTKRPEKMANFLINVYPEWTGAGFWPEDFPHVWIGTTVENQIAVDTRTIHLLNTPAKVRFLSCEPLLEDVRLNLRVDTCGRDLSDLPGLWNEDDRRIHWVIVGGESGQRARKMRQLWVRNIRYQCERCDVAFFYKQRIEDGKKITMPKLDGVIHDALPMGGIHGHKIEERLPLIPSKENE